MVVRLAITEGSAKVRTGGPLEEPANYDLPHWAGVVPLALVRGQPRPDESAARDVASTPSFTGREERA